MSIRTTKYPRIELALNQVYPDGVNNLEHLAAWAEYLALLNDADAYRNFWNHAEDRESDVNFEFDVPYFVMLDDGDVAQGKWVEPDLSIYGLSGAVASGWRLNCGIPMYDEKCAPTIVTHYAEIPPLPKKAQDEVKP